MALTEKTIIDKIEVVENNSIQIRTATIIQKNGVEIARTYHRHVLSPGDDISKEDLKVQSIANAIWTDEVINEFKLSLIVKPEPIVVQQSTQVDPVEEEPDTETQPNN